MIIINDIYHLFGTKIISHMTKDNPNPNVMTFVMRT